MEQYHSEYQTDVNRERLPSGKFATNQLILQIAVRVFNILRIMGQTPIGHPVPYVGRWSAAVSAPSSKTCFYAQPISFAMPSTIRGALSSPMAMPG